MPTVREQISLRIWSMTSKVDKLRFGAAHGGYNPKEAVLKAINEAITDIEKILDVAGVQ